MVLAAFTGCRRNQTDGYEAFDVYDHPTTQFVYCSDRSGRFQIWKHVDGDLTQLTFETAKNCWWPNVSTLGDKILYYQTDGEPLDGLVDSELWVMNIDGTSNQRLLRASTSDISLHGMASWSPDGDKIIFSGLNTDTKTWQLYEIDVASEEVWPLALRESANYYDPVYAPDGESVFCSVTPESADLGAENLELFEIDLLSNQEIRLTFNHSADHHPCVSPDGNSIIYESLLDSNYLSIGKWSIMHLDLSTATVTELIHDEYINLFPKFSWNGEFVIFNRLDIQTFEMNISQFSMLDAKIETIDSDTFTSVNPVPF